MPQHKINCPSCGQRLDVPEELAGEKTDCPTCQNVLTIPDFVHAFGEEGEIEAMPSHQSSTRMFGVIGVVIILLGAVGFFLISNEQISDSLSNHPNKETEHVESTDRIDESPKPTSARPEPIAVKVKAPKISIYQALQTGNIEAVKQHLAAGADVNAKGGGTTPLLVAVYGGHKEIAKLLITKGADVNARQGNLGLTPLHLAANNREIAELLIANGAHVNAKDKDGDTPLNFAIGRPQTAILLRKHGAKTGEELKAEGK